MLPRQSAKRLTAGLLITGLFVTPALAVTGTVDSGDSVLRVRSEASVAGKVLAKLTASTQVEVLSAVDGGAWYEITCGETSGFVSGEYLAVDAGEAAKLPEEAAPIYLKVTTSVLNIRTGPGTSYDKAGKLSDGQVVKALEETDGWYKLDEDKGYVSADYVQVVDAEEATVSSKGQEVANYALQFKGYKYVYGGSSPKGFDCSGFTTYVYSQFGHKLNRTASGQLDNGTKVSRDELQPGDLVIFKKGKTSKRATHVGLYIGDGKFIHASEPGVGVIISKLTDSYYTTGFVGGRRIV